VKKIIFFQKKKSNNKLISSPVKITVMDENGSSKDIQIKKSPVMNCLSMNAPNLFECNNNNNENPFNTESVENEGEYIFSNKLSDCNYYNYTDAKELEYQFNQIQKNALN